jgi:nucleoside-diphosphate-sugar epimerase
MRILFVGGTGLIGSACSAAALGAGHEVWVLHRGHAMAVPPPPETHLIRADARDPVALRHAVATLNLDVVVQWIGFTPADIEPDLSTFADVGQYIFISSASVYEKPPSRWMVREATTPLSNPFWAYARDKIACEALLHKAFRESHFPMTIVRPSLTYGLSQIPVCVNSWTRPFTIVARMRRGAKVIVPGDGTALWTLTHNSDFAVGLVGLLGQPAAIGEYFHITSNEALTWNQIYLQLADAVGAEPDLLHVPTDALVAADPSVEGSLWGDKVHSTVFDNSKLRGLVPQFEAKTPFAEGIRATVAWFDADPARQIVDGEADARWDSVAGVYAEALRAVAG